MSETPSIKSTKVRAIILAAVLLAIGLVLLIWPNTSSKVIAYALAGLITLSGIWQVIQYFRGASSLPFPSIAAGMTAVSVGVFLLLKVDLLIGIVAIALGILLIYLGFSMIETAIFFKKLGVHKWWIPVLLGVVTLALGFLSLFQVFSSCLMVFIAISLLVEAVLQIIVAILYGKLEKLLPEA